ncbi:MAG: hypothetical protein LBM38_02065 [Clostridiales bacterium]|jgi:hypothetical protein|nr:hypothetical protein [Clostridiales bacterium]
MNKFKTINQGLLVDSGIEARQYDYVKTIMEANEMAVKLDDSVEEYKNFFGKEPKLSKANYANQKNYFINETYNIKDPKMSELVRGVMEKELGFIEPSKPGDMSQYDWAVVIQTRNCIAQYVVAKEGLDCMSNDVKSMKFEIEQARRARQEARAETESVRQKPVADETLSRASVYNKAKQDNGLFKETIGEKIEPAKPSEYAKFVVKTAKNSTRPIFPRKRKVGKFASLKQKFAAAGKSVVNALKGVRKAGANAINNVKAAVNKGIMK